MTIKRKFKLYNNRPAQRIDEMNFHDLKLLQSHATAIANACGYADDGKGQNYWISVELATKAKIKEFQLKQEL